MEWWRRTRLYTSSWAAVGAMLIENKISAIMGKHIKDGLLLPREVSLKEIVCRNIFYSYNSSIWLTPNGDVHIAQAHMVHLDYFDHILKKKYSVSDDEMFIKCIIGSYDYGKNYELITDYCISTIKTEKQLEVVKLLLRNNLIKKYLGKDRENMNDLTFLKKAL